MTRPPGNHRAPLVTHRQSRTQREWQTLEVAAWQAEDRVQAQREVRRQVERVERGDLCPSEGYGFPASWFEEVAL